jgi:hypothetical protein
MTAHVSARRQIGQLFLNRVTVLNEGLRLAKFLRTRRAVLNGDALYHFTDEQLKQRDLMGPLAFNLYETVLAAFPATLLLCLLDWVWNVATTAAVADVTVLGFSDAVQSQMAAAASIANKIFAPLLVPGIALALSSVAGWASLRRKDSTPAARRRARDAYLYLDGAHGLVAECLVSLWLTLNAITFLNAPDLVRSYAGTAAGIVYVPMAVLCAWHAYGVHWSGIPSELFAINNYRTGLYAPSMMAQLDEPDREDGPRWKYRLSVLIGATPVAVGTLLVLNSLALVTAIAIAYLRSLAQAAVGQA